MRTEPQPGRHSTLPLTVHSCPVSRQSSFVAVVPAVTESSRPTREAHDDQPPFLPPPTEEPVVPGTFCSMTDRQTVKRMPVDGADPDVFVLHLPRDDVDEPEISIVIPALNEELTIGDFVDWCHEGLAAAGVVGEILIVDSSTDRHRASSRSPAARACCSAPKRGLGRAYIDALPFVRGEWIVMGDADCTYDFRQPRAVRRGVPRRLRVRHGLALEGLDRARRDAGAPPVLRHAGHDVDPQPPVLQPVLATSTAGCAASHATRSSAWTCSRSRGSTRRRWCSSRCTWSCAPPRCRSRSSRTARAG